uniref:Olfactory receptor n=1 Tax=Chrysemys picta bellii TaxID=8478 RepID=A0A8C3P8F3_CHRPI
MVCSCALNKASLKYSQLSWTPCPLILASQRILPIGSLKESKSAFLKSRVLILLLSFLPFVRILNSTISWSLLPRLPPTSTSPTNSFLFVSSRSRGAWLLVSSSMTEFILLGFTDDPQTQLVLFVVFLGIYIITLIGNLGMIALIHLDARLHNPMYFFLSNLSFSDLCYSTVVVPKTLENFLFYFYAVFATVECLLLAAMAYDRYVAICNPLLYPVLMSRKVCICLVVASYLVGCANGLIHTNTTFRLPFCTSNVIDHFFCDVPLILKLSCSDTLVNQVLLFVISSLIGLCSFLTIFVSYMYILISILRIHSTEGRYKAFSTCTSHLTAVTLFYTTILFIYLRPSSSYSEGQDQVAAVFYTVVIPMMNPLIYSLRNKEVKNALRRIVRRKGASIGA